VEHLLNFTRAAICLGYYPSMRRYRLLILVLSSCLLAAPLSAGSHDKDAELINRAVNNMNIFALPTFSMAAKLQIETQGKLLDGDYELLWNGPNQWRETTTFPGYSEIRVGGKGLVSLKRSTDFLPLRIFQMRAALGYGPAYGWGSFFHMEIRPKETITKVRDRKIRGSTVECAEITGPEKHRRELCLDQSKNAIIRPQFVDGEILPVGDKVYPRVLTYVEQGKVIAHVTITRFDSPAQLPASVFVPPEGSQQQPGCINPFPPRLVHRVNPSYPEQARQSYIEGTVYLDTLVGKDGVPRGLRVVSGVTQSLNDASLDAVRQWGFEPAICDGAPVDYETILTINYSLR
jgi:TonB family protein